MRLPSNYYHCFLGNGLDAVLIGPTGSMVSDKVGVDRCYWYKSDRYYPEEKLVQVAGRFPLDRPLEHAPGSAWFEIAPLGRAWYEVSYQGNLLEPQSSQQRFVPQEGALYSHVDYGPLQVDVTTYLHAACSLLVERYEFTQEVKFKAWMGPGVWVEEGWDTDPFLKVEPSLELAQTLYDLGETQGLLAMRLDPPPTSSGRSGDTHWQAATGLVFTRFFTITDNRQGPLQPDLIDRSLQNGFSALYQEHLQAWKEYFAVSSVEIPDSQFQSFYDNSLYHFKAMQNPLSGGLPVNNLRRTWSSHVFWDSYFIHRALLESNRRSEALEACRFLQRTQEHARLHASQEFGCEGLKWDWEITHDGRKAYGVLLHMKDQVHNNASYANQIVQYYEFTQDEAMLQEFYPLLEGLARFFLCNVIERANQGYETRAVVGVHESPIRVKNDGITLAGAIAILRHAARSAALLGMESDFSQHCAEVASGLMQTFGKMYNGRYFVASKDNPGINMSSLAPIYPMNIVEADDPRSFSTAQAYAGYYRGRMVGHGGSQHGFPWSAGVLATIFARQGLAEQAWEVIESTRPALCYFGGMTEVVEDDLWNMQYFGTAQAAVCSAIHNMLLQPHAESVRLFPAIPKAWQSCSFANLLAAGLEVTAAFDRRQGSIGGMAHNISDKPLTRTLQAGRNAVSVRLDPQDSYGFHWTL